MMKEKIQRLRVLLGEVMDLQYTAAVLGWDQQTYMPPGGAGGRAMQLSTIGRLAHEKFVNDELGQLLDDLKSEVDGEADSDDARLVKQTAREYEKQRKVPSEFVAEFSRVTALAHQNWDKARNESNFSIFQSDLVKIIELRQEYANFFAPFDHIYDPLLDDFEPGMKTAEVQKVFDDLRPKQVALVQAIADSAHPIDDSQFLAQCMKQVTEFMSKVSAKI
jgi:carboxypeptidase Taq